MGFDIQEFKFTILGKAKAKQSVKFGINGIKYTPKDMVDYANWVKLSFMEEYPKHNPTTLNDSNFLEIEIKVYMQYPKSFSKKKVKLAEAGIVKPTVKPDWDNISKNICDALNGVAYMDDKNIAKGSVEKIYSDFDKTDVVLKAYKWTE